MITQTPKTSKECFNPQSSPNIWMPYHYQFLLRLVHHHLTNQYIGFSDIYPNAEYMTQYIHQAIHSENTPLLKILFQEYIKAHKKNPDKFLNAPLWQGRKLVTPLFFATEKGFVKVVELFVENKDYIDNVDFQCNGHTALDVAALNGHNDIVKMLIPWMIEAQAKKLNKIQNFVGATNSDESVANDYLFLHNWDINAAIQSFKIDTEENPKKILNFVETTCTSDESVAKTYLSRHNWDINAALQSFFNDKSAIVSRNLYPIFIHTLMQHTFLIALFHFSIFSLL